MARFYDRLTPELIGFIGQQKLFFTASGMATGRINISPKGTDSLRVLSPTEVAYADLTGSGAETVAHAHHDGRITLMFMSLTDKPLILRLYGHATTFTPDSIEGQQLRTRLPVQPAIRQLIRIAIGSVQTSCGYAVPLFDYCGERDTYERWVEKKGHDGIESYWRERNARSVDGLQIGLFGEEPQQGDV